MSPLQCFISHQRYRRRAHSNNWTAASPEPMNKIGRKWETKKTNDLGVDWIVLVTGVPIKPLKAGEKGMEYAACF